MLRVAIVGADLSGKTSLVEALLGRPFIERDPIGHVYGEDASVCEKFTPAGSNLEVELIDTYFYRQAGGRGDWEQLKWKNYSSAHVVVYCANYTAWLYDRQPFAETFLPEIEAALPWAKVIVARTFTDLVDVYRSQADADKLVQLWDKSRMLLAEEAADANVPVVDVSAKTGLGLDDLLKLIVECGPKAMAAEAKTPRRKKGALAGQPKSLQVPEAGQQFAQIHGQKPKKKDCTIL